MTDNDTDNREDRGEWYNDTSGDSYREQCSDLARGLEPGARDHNHNLAAAITVRLDSSHYVRDVRFATDTDGILGDYSAITQVTLVAALVESIADGNNLEYVKVLETAAAMINESENIDAIFGDREGEQ